MSCNPCRCLVISPLPLFFLAVSGQCAWGGTGGHLRDLHRAGLEHGLQLFSVAENDFTRSGRGEPQLPALRLAAFLAARSAVRHAGPDLEHNDVHVRRMVLRGGVGSHCRRRSAYRASGNWLLRRTCDRAPKSCCRRVGDRGDDNHDPHLRSTFIPSVGHLGRQVPLRADRCTGGAQELRARFISTDAACKGGR